MPHSLRAQLKTLKYKGLLKEKEYDRLRYALDVVDGRIKMNDEERKNTFRKDGKVDGERM